MGMTIDKTIEFFNGLECHTPQAKDARNIAVDTMRKYQMIEADYKARLKADMVAMLTDLKNKLIDKSWNIDMYDDDLDFECCYLNDIDEVIQQKINALKGDSDGT